MVANVMVSISLTALKDAIRDQYLSAVARGRDWHYVTVWPDGSIVRGCEPSPIYSQSEYFRRGKPWPVTCWTLNGVHAGFPECVYESEECPEAEATCWADRTGSVRDERSDRYNLPRKLTDSMIEDLDWDSLLDGLQSKLAEAGYMLV